MSRRAPLWPSVLGIALGGVCYVLAPHAPALLGLLAFVLPHAALDALGWYHLCRNGQRLSHDAYQVIRHLTVFPALWGLLWLRLGTPDALLAAVFILPFLYTAAQDSLYHVFLGRIPPPLSTADHSHKTWCLPFHVTWLANHALPERRYRLMSWTGGIAVLLAAAAYEIATRLAEVLA